jgi:hypothetical protein
MADDQEVEEGYICIAAGRKVPDGQVAIYEVHPDHPWVPSARNNGTGEHQVTVVRGSATEGVAWAARTPEVQTYLGRGYLVEVKAPAGLKAALDGPPTESSARVANREDQLEAVNPPEVAGSEIRTEEQLKAAEAELATAREELKAYREAEQKRVDAEAKTAAEAKKAADEKAAAEANRAKGQQGQKQS